MLATGRLIACAPSLKRSSALPVVFAVSSMAFDEGIHHRPFDFPRPFSPNSTGDFWEDLSASKFKKCLILLVGAAGFEPTTCSTQNCRATRLRYTPIISGKRCRYTLKAPPAMRLADAQWPLK